MKNLLLYITVSLLFCACADDPRPPLPDEMPLVVEGWIEENERPIVIVTRAIDLTKPMDSLDKYVEKWHRVSISDGNKTYYLTGRINKNYIPSFVFTSSRFRGKVGVEYSLKIETPNGTYDATAKMTPHVRIDSTKVAKVENSDSLYSITAYPRINPEDGGFYKFFTKVINKEKRYYSSFLGTFEGATYSPDKGFNVCKGIHNTYEDQFSPFYCKGDTVDIKICTLSKEQFDFWTAYENSVSLAGNMFFNVAKDCPSNIDGALGYWFAYGISEVRVIIR